MAKVHATLAEQLEIKQLLDFHLTSTDEGYEYVDNWNDARVAQEVSDRLNAGHVAHVRRQFDMHLSRPRTPTEVLESRVANLEAANLKHLEEFHRLSDRLTALARDVIELQGRLPLAMKPRTD